MERKIEREEREKESDRNRENEREKQREKEKEREKKREKQRKKRQRHIIFYSRYKNMLQSRGKCKKCNLFNQLINKNPVKTNFFKTIAIYLRKGNTTNQG